MINSYIRRSLTHDAAPSTESGWFVILALVASVLGAAIGSWFSTFG